MQKDLEAYTDPNDPPFPPKGKYAQWNGSEWVMLDIPAPIPPKPADVDGYEWKWDGKAWVKEALPPPPPPPTELQKAEAYLQNTAWLFIDGIIDLFKNGAEIKAARAAALEILKAHKAELSLETPKFD